METDSLKQELAKAYEQSLCLKETAVAYQDGDSYWLFRGVSEKIKQAKELLDKHEWKVKA